MLGRAIPTENPSYTSQIPIKITTRYMGQITTSPPNTIVFEKFITLGISK